MRLLLLRHGRTEANERHLYCGSTDLPLSEAGRRELSDIKKSGSLPGTEGFRFVSSGMRRCAETLGLLFGERESLTLPAFREVDFGDFEMRSYEELKEDPQYITWISGDNEVNVPPRGESGAQMTARVLGGLAALRRENVDTVLVTHGGPIAAIMAYLFPEEGKNRYEWQPKPGHGYLLELDRDFSKVSRF